jgi:hypothetical protein
MSLMFTSVALALLVKIDDACVLLQGNQYEAQVLNVWASTWMICDVSGGLTSVVVGVSAFCGWICYSMRAIAFWRVFMLHIGKRKSTEYIINTVGTFVSKEKIMFK